LCLNFFSFIIALTAIDGSSDKTKNTDEYTTEGVPEAMAEARSGRSVAKYDRWKKIQFPDNVSRIVFRQYWEDIETIKGEDLFYPLLNPVRVFFEGLEGTIWSISDQNLNTAHLVNRVITFMKRVCKSSTIAGYCSAICKFLTDWQTNHVGVRDLEAHLNLNRLEEKFKEQSRLARKAAKLDIKERLEKLKVLLPTAEDFNFVENSDYYTKFVLAILKIPEMDDSELTMKFLSDVTTFLIFKLLLDQPLRQQGIRELKLTDYLRDWEALKKANLVTEDNVDPLREMDLCVRVPKKQKTQGTSGSKKVRIQNR
jgi:hypothetical protein